jgi:Protein of unknown function (DUF3311)
VRSQVRARRYSSRRDGKSRWHLLLIMPVFLPLSIPLFNRLEPRVIGIPFFYWSQFALIGFATLVTAIVHMLTKRAGNR